MYPSTTTTAISYLDPDTSPLPHTYFWTFSSLHASFLNTSSLPTSPLSLSLHSPVEVPGGPVRPGLPTCQPLCNPTSLLRLPCTPHLFFLPLPPRVIGRLKTSRQPKHPRRVADGVEVACCCEYSSIVSCVFADKFSCTASESTAAPTRAPGPTAVKETSLRITASSCSGLPFPGLLRPRSDGVILRPFLHSRGGRPHGGSTPTDPVAAISGLSYSTVEFAGVGRVVAES